MQQTVGIVFAHVPHIGVLPLLWFPRAETGKVPRLQIDAMFQRSRPGAPARGERAEERMQPAEYTSTAGSIARYAGRAGSRTAIVEDGARYSYATVAQDLCHCVAGLTSLGVAPGILVGIELRQRRYLNLLLLLASEVIGATTTSLTRAELGDDDDPVLPHCDLLLMRDPAPAPRSALLQAIPDDWPTRLADDAPCAGNPATLMHAVPPEHVVGIVRTSGTTGRPKALDLTFARQQRLIDMHLARILPDIAPNPVSLCAYNLGIRSFQIRVRGILQHGGTVIFAPEQHACPLLASGAVNHALFTVGDMERLVRQATPPPPGHVLHIEMVGAHVSRRLRALIRQHLRARISTRYSANETGMIADNDADDIGTLCEGASVRIVDEAGHDRPAGEIGLIHARTSTMAHAYRNAPAQTAAAFVDGWYVTNDIGYLTDAGRLVVLGRADDVLNIGGIKIPPRPLEDALCALPGVRDAVVLSVAAPSGIAVLVVAVEVGDTRLPDGLMPQIGRIVSVHVRHFEVLPLPWFPRTETGKVRRQEIDAMFRRSRTGAAWEDAADMTVPNAALQRVVRQD